MRNDDKTFSAIVREYTEPLYWHIRRLVVSHDDAQDILQESFIKAFRHLWQLKDEKSLRPWLYRIATNEAFRSLDKRKNEDELNGELMERLEDERFINLDEIAGIQLQKAILSLPRTQRTVFSLRYYDEMTYEEIAAVTGSSPESLKVSWHIARKKVEEHIKRELI